MLVPDFTLIDPRPIAAEAPYTFFVPTAGELEAVAKGDVVKLAFEYTAPAERWAVERMWVVVADIDGAFLRGELNNHPDEPTSPLKAGDEIAFHRYHVLQIDWANPKSAPVRDSRREYWERCLVDDCVLQRHEPIGYIYREAPDMAQEDDVYPDSGWRIRGRFGDATEEEIDARTLSYVAIGAVLNADDSWLSLVDAPVGARFLRDFGTDRYEEER